MSGVSRGVQSMILRALAGAEFLFELRNLVEVPSCPGEEQGKKSNNLCIRDEWEPRTARERRRTVLHHPEGLHLQRSPGVDRFLPKYSQGGLVTIMGGLSEGSLCWRMWTASILL